MPRACSCRNNAPFSTEALTDGYGYGQGTVTDKAQTWQGLLNLSPFSWWIEFLLKPCLPHVRTGMKRIVSVNNQPWKTMSLVPKCHVPVWLWKVTVHSDFSPLKWKQGCSLSFSHLCGDERRMVLGGAHVPHSVDAGDRTLFSKQKIAGSHGVPQHL